MRRTVKLAPAGGLSLDAIVDLAGVESFPASDPPSWSPTRAGAPAPPGVARGPELLHEVIQQLRDDVRLLGREIGERNTSSTNARKNLKRAADVIESRLSALGIPVKRRPQQAPVPNVEAVLLGVDKPSECIVVGAHYDSPRGSRGILDNASGVAALLAMAPQLARARLGRTVRLVAFVGDHSARRRKDRGSVRYLEGLLREGPTVAAMMSLDVLGAMHGPPSRLGGRFSNALLVLGDRRSRRLRRWLEHYGARAGGEFGVASLTFPWWLPGLWRADHVAFARRGIPAVMITDAGWTRVLRHSGGTRSMDGVDYERLGRQTAALSSIARSLAGAEW